MRVRKHLASVVVVSLALALTPWSTPAQAGPAYEKSGKYDDLPTFEGKVVTVDTDGGRLGLRGDGGFRIFSTSPKKLNALEKGMPVRVTYERSGSGNRAVRIVPLVIPEGASPAEDVAAAKEKLIKEGVLQPETAPKSP